MKIIKIADFINGKLTGDGEIEIFNVASIEKAQKGEISFIENAEFVKKDQQITASCLIIPENLTAKLPCSTIKVKSPKLAFAQIAGFLHPPIKREPNIHNSVAISQTASIGRDVFIGAFCCIGENSIIGDRTQIRAGAIVGDNVTIGEDCMLHPNVFIEDNSEIGNNVILHSGVSIGTDGFGYVRDKNEYIKFPQIGKVIIEDNVEIGANSCVDRGALGETRIGEGTKIDNLVQVAHNVTIGKRVIIAAQTGISGSVIIEDDCIIAGQVGFADHTIIKKGAIIGAKSAVFPGKIVREGIWSGIPVQPMDEYKRQHAHIRSIPRLKEEIKKLKKKIYDSE